MKLVSSSSSSSPACQHPFSSRGFDRELQGKKKKKKKTHLANDKECTERERDVHGRQDLNESFHDGHDALRVRVVSRRTKHQIEVQRLLRTRHESRVEQRRVQSSVESIRDGLYETPSVIRKCTIARKNKGRREGWWFYLHVSQPRRDR